MGFLSRLTGRESRISLSALQLPGGAWLSVVGESYYQPALNETAKAASRGGEPPFPVTARLRKKSPPLWFQAVLVREPNNEYDSDAIAVHGPCGKIGHLSRDDAFEYQDVLLDIEARGSQAAACSAYMEKANNGMWGVVLALSSPDDCLAELDE
jgi:hypothetical protein